MPSCIVLDASAVLAMLDEEHGAEEIAATLGNAVLCAWSLAEVVTALRRRNLLLADVERALGFFHFDVRATTAAHAIAVGSLIAETTSPLTTGQAACLILARELGGAAIFAGPTCRLVAEARYGDIEIRLLAPPAIAEVIDAC